jgi:hypothetical protein
MSKRGPSTNGPRFWFRKSCAVISNVRACAAAKASGGRVVRNGLSWRPACDLLACAVSALAHYAPAFMLERYEDKDYQRLLDSWPSTGQLGFLD